MIASHNNEADIQTEEEEDHSSDLQIVPFYKNTQDEKFVFKQMKVEPLYQAIRSGMTFHLYSDFYLDLDVVQGKSVKEQMLACSHFKKVVQVKHLVQEQIVILKNENVTPPLKDFRVLTQILSQQRYKRFKVISNLLKEYQKVIFGYDQQISLLRVQSILNETSMEAKLQARKEFFDKKIKERFKELTQEGAFFTYNKASINIHDGQFEVSEQGFSDSLISLLGSDPEQFSATVMRRGLLSIVEERNRDIFNIGRLTFEIFEAEKKNQSLRGCVASLLTFDEQKITCPTVVEHFFIDYPPELQLQSFTNENTELMVTEHAFLVIYEVSINTLKQVIATRAKNPVFQNNDWVNDFGYSVMSEILLDKYYSVNQNSTKSRQSCSFPTLSFPDGLFSV